MELLYRGMDRARNKSKCSLCRGGGCGKVTVLEKWSLRIHCSEGSTLVKRQAYGRKVSMKKRQKRRNRQQCLQISSKQKISSPR